MIFKKFTLRHIFMKMKAKGEVGLYLRQLDKHIFRES